MKFNIKTISELTGFSPATVSNALNGKRGVSRATAERILAVAREHGYQSTNKVDSIKLVIYKKNGIVVADTPFFSELIQGVEEEGRSAGYTTAVCNLDQRSPSFSEVRAQLLSDPSSAILLLATEMEEADIAPFAQAAAPVVLLDSWAEETVLDAVLISNTDSVYRAVKYLLEKGHRKIGYLKGSIRIKNFFYREMGYRRALRGAGLDAGPAYTFSLTPTMEGAYDDMRRMLAGRPELPTAFFADNDIIALGAMRALWEHGCKIPEDISVVGFDDLPFSAISYPALTTIRVPKREMGRVAVRRLAELIKRGEDVKTKTQVCNTFIERASVRDLNA